MGISTLTPPTGIVVRVFAYRGFARPERACVNGAFSCAVGQSPLIGQAAQFGASSQHHSALI
jgi:hypothetical protein